MTLEEKKEGEEQKEHPTPKHSSYLAAKHFEGIREEVDEMDNGCHTYTGRDRYRLYGKNLDLSGKFNKYRSHSFSGVPRRKSSAIAGSAKVRAISSRHNSVHEGNGKRISQETHPSRKTDHMKAVTDYYDRHPLSLSNEKHYDSFNGFGDFPRKETSSSFYDRCEAGPTIPTTRKFHSSVYWILHNRSKYGFRHICMLILVLAYTMLGAALFFSVESSYEKKTVAIRKAALDAKVEVIAEQLRQFYNTTDEIIDILLVEKFIKRSYIALLKEESLYSGSTYYKTADPSNYKWTYPSAIFFSMNIYTTTGYGSIAPDSMLGRFFVICFSLITIPITLVVIRDLGQWTLVILTKIYAYILVAFRSRYGLLCPHSLIQFKSGFGFLKLRCYTLTGPSTHQGGSERALNNTNYVVSELNTSDDESAKSISI